MSIALNDVCLAYDGVPVLDHVSLEVAPRERRAVMGPSGAGKSTLLRVLAGLERPDQGRIMIDGQDVTDVPAHRRRVGLMFQDNALFPHLDVRANVAYGLRMTGVSNPERTQRVDDLLELVGLGGYGTRNVASLSGGEAQRVALARTLAPQPRLILLDEPMGAIDQARKDDLMIQIRTIVDRVGTTSIYVTHDRLEAEAYADTISVLVAGSVVRTGAPPDLWERPEFVSVAKLMGRANVVDGAVVGADAAAVVVPVDAITIEPGGQLSGTVVSTSFRDGVAELTVDVGGTNLRARDPGGFAAGEVVSLRVDRAKLIPLAVDQV
ncbi:MAG: ABC transporter ATP-binding protein [Acidimicrobiia bacterium]|nr:ABC transporter ATP-binding protein [Acidimicrobiia bacterium]